MRVFRISLHQTHFKRLANRTGRLVQGIKLDLVITRSSKRPSCEAFVRIRRAIPVLEIFCAAISCSICNAIASLMTLIPRSLLCGLPFENARRSSVEYPVSLLPGSCIHLIQKSAPDGTSPTVFGKKETGPGEFQDPLAVAVADDETVFVMNFGNNRVQQRQPIGRP